MTSPRLAFSHFSIIALLVLTGSAHAQPTSQLTLELQDLNVTTIATGLAHAGDMGVDAFGNVWIMQVQGAVGGSTGLLTMIDATGFVSANLGAPLSEMGDFALSPQGLLYAWMNISSGVTSLCCLLQNGTVVSQSTHAGYQGLGLAVDPANGDFILGSRGTSVQTGIFRRNLGAQMSPYGPGIPGENNVHLLYTPQGRLLSGDSSVIYDVTAGAPNSIRYQIQGNARLQDWTNGYFGQLLVIHEQVGIVPGGIRTLRQITPEGFETIIGTLPASGLAPDAQICADPNGDGYYLLDQGTLFRITGPAGMFTVGEPTPTTWTARVDHDGSSAPFILAMDNPGISISIPSWGTFATSLGTGPGWQLIFDGLGVFKPVADSFAQAPWSLTVNQPTPPVGIPVTLQAYILDPFVSNGAIKITNAVTINL